MSFTRRRKVTPDITFIAWFQAGQEGSNPFGVGYKDTGEIKERLGRR